MEDERALRRFMAEAIEEAKLGLREGGIPIGSVLVKEERIIGRGHNMQAQKNDPLAHAEIECLRNAGRVGSYKGTTVFSTLMPCYLCGGAVVQFGIKRVVAGESENLSGSRKFLEANGVEVIDLNIEECKKIMKEFILTKPEIWKEDIGKL